jgi:hypothetical protein
MDITVSVHVTQVNDTILNLSKMRVSRLRGHIKRAEEFPASILLDPNASYLAFVVLKKHQSVTAINASAHSA